MPTDYSILSAPRISLGQFRNVLTAAHSPAAPEAAGMYSAALTYGVDPAVMLAVFQHESSFGKAGYANPNHSVGNLRTSPDYPSNGAGGFVDYPTWTAGAADAARLLSVYGANEIRPGTKTSSVLTMPYVWAPAADHNAPAAYGNALSRSIASWSGSAGTKTPAPTAPKASAPAPTVVSIHPPAWATAAGVVAILAIVLLGILGG